MAAPSGLRTDVASDHAPNAYFQLEIKFSARHRVRQLHLGFAQMELRITRQMHIFRGAYVTATVLGGPNYGHRVKRP